MGIARRHGKAYWYIRKHGHVDEEFVGRGNGSTSHRHCKTIS